MKGYIALGSLVLVVVLVLGRVQGQGIGGQFYPDPNVGTNASLAECEHGPWPPIELYGKEPLTVIWSIGSDASEREWIHDWLLARVRRPIITIVEEVCPPKMSFGKMQDPRGGRVRNPPTDVLWVVHGAGSAESVECFAGIIQQESLENNVRFGLLHLSDEFAGSSMKCNESVSLFCASAYPRLYPLSGVRYVLRNYWSADMIPTGTADAWKNKIKWIPLGVTRGFGRPNSNMILPGSVRKWPCLFTGSASQIPTSPRQRFLTSLPSLNLANRYGCFMATSATWGGGFSKQEYRHMLQESAIVFCPGGNYAMDTFRVWEALAAGAVPIIERGSRFDWAALPKDNPLIFIDNWDNIHNVLEQLGTTVKIDAKQKVTMSWWRSYVRQLQQMVADIIG